MHRYIKVITWLCQEKTLKVGYRPQTYRNRGRGETSGSLSWNGPSVRWHKFGDVFDRGDYFALLAMTPETCHCEQSEAISPVENTRPYLRN